MGSEIVVIRDTFETDDEMPSPAQRRNDRMLRRVKRRAPHTGKDHFRQMSDEIVLNIFNHLGEKDLGRCARVCKRFHDIAQDKSLWTKIDRQSKTLTYQNVHDILSRGPIVLRLAHAEILDSRKGQPIHGHNFNRVMYLDLSVASITGPDLVRMLSECKQLIKLSLERLTITDEVCFAIAGSTNLEILNLSGCFGIAEVGLGRIVKCCKKMRELNLAWTYLHESAVKTLCENLHGNYKKLNLSGFKKALTDEYVTWIVENCPNLVTLDLSHSTALTEHVLPQIKRLNQLEHVSFSRCCNIGLSAYGLLANMPSLVRLDIFNIIDRSSLMALQDSLPNVQLNRIAFIHIARPTCAARKDCIWGHQFNYRP